MIDAGEILKEIERRSKEAHDQYMVLVKGVSLEDARGGNPAFGRAAADLLGQVRALNNLKTWIELRVNVVLDEMAHDYEQQQKRRNKACPDNSP